MTDVPEQAVIGNSQMLATIGKQGELRYLFWPTIDYPQHILGSLPGVFYSNRNVSEFRWLTDFSGERKQKYLANANAVVTIFTNSEAGLNITATDFVLPNADVLIRRFLFQNAGIDDVFLRFFYYNDLAISETDIDDVAYYLQKHDVVIHYKRNFYFAYGGTSKSSGHQCGVHGESSDAFNDTYDSELSGGSLVLYDGIRAVNSCLSWDVGVLQSGQETDFAVLVAMGSNEEEVLKFLNENRRTEFAVLLERTEDYWKTWVSAFKLDFGDQTVNRMVRRSLVVLKALSDKNHGGIIAAPCMEPEYRFCWPRDATFVAYALDRCGFHRESKKFYRWCKRAQEPEGGLYQRYYIEAKIRGPCWSSQIDEVATVVWGIGRHFDLTGNRGFMESMWPMIEKAAHFMCENMDPSTNLLRSVGLWEEKFGSHTYSNAAVYRALKTAARTAKIMRQNALHRQWSDSAEKIKLALLELAWDSQNEHFIKTIGPKDNSLDVSLLGLAFPFEVLSADDERMRKTALAIEQSFNYKVGGIGRYCEDTYYGGNPWVLATLWLALYYEQCRELDKAKQLINWATHRATGLDLLSEQIDKLNGTPISAIPLAWSHAFLILAVLGLDELQRSE